MKNKMLLLLLILPFIDAHAQDSAEKWKPFFVGTILNCVPVNSISGTDTGYSNALSFAPYVSIRNRGGWGIMYSPRIVTGGARSGIYLHELSAGVSQYDNKLYNYELKYSHYFFTNSTSVPYTPLSNEIYGSFAYKKSWLMPSIAMGIGFGSDTTSGNPSSAYDYGISVGVSHAFEWDGDQVSFSLIPRILLNGGTNQYFSFLHFNKYISHSKQFLNYVKTVPGRSTSSGGGRGRGTGSGSTGGSTTTSGKGNTAESFSLSNFELGFESEIDMGNFAMRPEACLFIPVGSQAGSNVFGFWQVTLEYRF